MNLDDRDANGFWERFTVNSVHGKFQCEDSEGCGNVWKSVQIQVDLRVKLVLHSWLYNPPPVFILTSVSLQLCGAARRGENRARVEAEMLPRPPPWRGGLRVPWPRGGRGRRLGHGETQEQDPEGFLLQPRWSDAGILSWLLSPLGWEQGPPQRRLWGRPVSNVWYSLDTSYLH